MFEAVTASDIFSPNDFPSERFTVVWPGKCAGPPLSCVSAAATCCVSFDRDRLAFCIRWHGAKPVFAAVGQNQGDGGGEAFAGLLFFRGIWAFVDRSWTELHVPRAASDAMSQRWSLSRSAASVNASSTVWAGARSDGIELPIRIALGAHESRSTRCIIYTS